MGGADLAILMKLVDQASGPLKSIQGAVGSVGDAATKAKGAVGGFVDGLGKIGLAGLGIKAIVDSVGALAQGMVSGNAEFERYQTQFGVLLGSADEAKTRLAELTEFGAKTPFELPEIVRADKVLTSFGLDAKDTFDRFKVSAKQIRTTIGDVAAGTGVNFEELALTFGKFASGATGEAIARFQELGIATREQMASWGLQFSKSGELLTPAREAFSVLESHVRQKFGGMMDAQSMTFEGMMSNLSDWMGAAQRTVMAPVFEVLKERLAGLLTFLNSDDAQAGMKAFADGMARAVQFAVDLGSKIGSYLQPVLVSVLPVFQALFDIVKAFATGGVTAGMEQIFAALYDPLKSVGIEVGALAEKFWELYDTAAVLFSQLSNVVTKVLNGDLRGAFAGLMDIMAETVPAIRTKLLEWATEFLAWLGPILPPLFEQLLLLATQLLTWITDQVPPMAERLGAWIMELWAWVQKVVPPLMEQLGVLLTMLLDWIIMNAPPLAQKLIGEWIPAFIGWVAKAAIDIIPKLVEFLGAIVKWILEVGIPKILELATKMGESIIKGIRQGLRNVSIPLPEIRVGTREGPMGIQVPTLDIGVMWKSLGELIPQLAAGGVIEKPTLAMIGEGMGAAGARREIVTPENLMRKIIREEGGGGGPTVGTLVIQSPEPLTPSSYRRQTEHMLRSLALEYGAI